MKNLNLCEILLSSLVGFIEAFIAYRWAKDRFILIFSKKREALFNHSNQCIIRDSNILFDAYIDQFFFFIKKHRLRYFSLNNINVSRYEK